MKNPKMKNSKNSLSKRVICLIIIYFILIIALTILIVVFNALGNKDGAFYSSCALCLVSILGIIGSNRIGK